MFPADVSGSTVGTAYHTILKRTAIACVHNLLHLAIPHTSALPFFSESHTSQTDLLVNSANGLFPPTEENSVYSYS